MNSDVQPWHSSPVVPNLNTPETENSGLFSNDFIGDVNSQNVSDRSSGELVNISVVESIQDESIYVYSENSCSNSSIDCSTCSKSGLKCLYLNTDTVTNKWTELECIVYNLQPDLIGITETFPKSTGTVSVENYVLQGFNQYINVDNSCRRTILFVKPELETQLYEKLNRKKYKNQHGVKSTWERMTNF